MSQITQLAQSIAIDADKNFLDNIISFIDKGGVFIYFIILCSIAAIAVMLYQAMILVRQKVIPENLVYSMNHYVSQDDEESMRSLNSSRETSPSVLQKICDLV